MKRNIIVLITVSIVLFACAGTDPTDIDHTPPSKPTLFSHAGDTGDITETVIIDSIVFDTLNFYKSYDSVIHQNSLEQENNGIDAVSTNGDFLQIQWRHLSDTDIDRIDIFRFNLQDNDTLRIAQVAPADDYFIDEFTDYDETSTSKDWFYYIEAFDEAGNSTVSDTVCYHLFAQPVLEMPNYDNEYSVTDSIVFEWIPIDSATDYNLIIFDQERNIIWQKIPLDPDPEDDDYNGKYKVIYKPENEGQLISQEYTVRVDTHGNTSNEFVNGTLYEIKLGSESEERKFRIN
ncbi:MAG: hypothetical protein K8S23_10440 [Candidatus Cloacimonetes bacterium]|nr:hypothetical protein [Candidatus Cloacimonadota bacterium]